MPQPLTRTSVAWMVSYGSGTTSSATCFGDLAVALHTLADSPEVLPGNPGKHTLSPLISVIPAPSLGAGKGGLHGTGWKSLNYFPVVVGLHER